MSKIVDLSNEGWMKHKPPKHRDIRINSHKFWKLSAAQDERQERIRILKKAPGKTSQRLVKALIEPPPRKPASVGCCPLLARRFQVFFSSRALRVAELQADDGVRYTLLDAADAVPFGKLDTVNWSKLHMKLRRRLERHLGPNVVVYGMGEVEADDTRGVWQPHHHLTIHGVTDDGLKSLRKRHYKATRTGIRPMVKSKPQDLGTWLSYNSKLVAFAKTPGIGPSHRGRLTNYQSWEYFRYLSRNRPTSFVFSMNCRIVRSSEGE
mgnify:CR=1 FL=1